MTTKEKDFISDGLNNEDISLTIKKIISRAKDKDVKELKENDKYELLKKEFDFFASRYPMLFDLAVRNENFPWDNLNYMLNMRNKIINDELSSEGASKIVGKEWFDKYVNLNDIPKNKKNKNK